MVWFIGRSMSCIMNSRLLVRPRERICHRLHTLIIMNSIHSKLYNYKNRLPYINVDNMKPGGWKHKKYGFRLNTFLLEFFMGVIWGGIFVWFFGGDFFLQFWGDFFWNFFGENFFGIVFFGRDLFVEFLWVLGGFFFWIFWGDFFFNDTESFHSS